MPFPRPVIAALAAGAILAVPGAARAADVTIANKAFGPTGATIASGQAVTWHWGDGPHNVHVTAGPEQFDSGIRPAASTFTHTFTAPGVYTYQCDVHPSMHGLVTVTGLAAATPGPALVAAPRLSAVRVSSLAVVRVTATAPATLQARILSAGRTVEHGSARLVAGTNRIPLPVRALALGRYHVQLTALDAAGRSFFRVTRTLVVTRATRSRAAAAAPVVAPAPVTAPVLAAPADDHGGRRAG